MKTFATLSREYLRKGWLLFDYLMWLLFDFSKFKFINKDRIKKVLVVHLGAIGDIIITTPLVRALKEELNASVEFMLNNGKDTVYKNNPNLNKIIVFNKDNNKNINNLKKGNYDLAVIISTGSEKLSKISLMCRKSGINYIVGVFGAPRRGLGLFFTRRIFPLSKKHTVQKNLDIIRKIGIAKTFKSPKLEFFISEEENKSASLKLRNLKLKKSYIIIHPGFGFLKNSKYPTRLWPITRYAKVIDILISRNNLNVLITGSEEEKILADRIYSLSKNKDEIRVTNGNFSFGELAHVISKSKLVITPGTSTVHLTSALNIPLVELVGKEELSEWHPWQKKDNYITLFHPEVCTECNLLECRLKTTECLKAISVDEVVKASNKLLLKNYEKN